MMTNRLYESKSRHYTRNLWLTATVALVILVTFPGAVAAIEAGDAELSFTPRLFMGSVAWSQLRREGGHKSMGGVDGTLDYRRGDWIVGLRGQTWWVTEGMDSNQGMMPEGGYRLGIELRRLIDIGDGFSVFPFASLEYEAWRRDELDPDVWSKLGFMNGVAGLGLDHARAHLKAGVGHAFAASTNQGGNPEGRVGFETEAGMRLKDWTIGIFWRGAGFQEPDAKLVQTAAFLGYTF